MKPVRLLLPAEREMGDAAWFYESKTSGLGKDFLDRLESAVRDIARQPQRWPRARGQIRRRLVFRFPCAALYRETAKEIVAVAHLRRKPNHRSKR